ncbi:DnaJ domain-containing protein [Sphingomonas bacterium]|uniref:DnaJ domain-containing protein n=1 Tax=Sphingomonas bacterium TaxID=1895847 RepID=UPI0020C6C566|nr:DnaJ domain-containing protein [Sphingomonas bacterium]
MIALVLLAAAAIGYWAWKTRDSQAMRFGDVAAVVAALVGLRLFSRSETLPALLALSGAAWWLWFRRSGKAEGGMSDDEARRLLEVPRDASPQAIRAAHRRLILRVHPDAGGSADLTARVNEARDTLLARRSLF